jgi:hypothetical protein
MTPAGPAVRFLGGYFRCRAPAEAGISLSLRHQRLSFAFSGVRFSHREDGGFDDRNYTREARASEKDG